MFMTNSTLMRSQHPSLEQSGYSVTVGQQVVAYLCRTAYHLVAIPDRIQSAIAFPRIGTNHSSRIHGFLDSFFQAFSGGIRDTSKSNPTNTIPIYLRRYHYQALSEGATSPFAWLFSPHVRLIHLNPARKPVPSGPDHRASKFVQPSPRRIVTAQAEHPLQSQRTGTCFLTCHPPHRSKPHGQGLTGMLKDGPRHHRGLVSARSADQQATTVGRPHSLSLTPRALEPFWPTQSKKIGTTGLFRGKPRLKLGKCSGIIFHAAAYYILGSLESTEYPHSFISIRFSWSRKDSVQACNSTRADTRKPGPRVELRLKK